MKRAAFAIPGDISTLTGGYIYERRLLEALREAGHDVTHLELADSFPDPSPEDMADTITRLTALEPDRAVILDGLAFGALRGLEQITAPMVAMIHHPLALETGLSPERQASLYQTERRNLELARHVLVPSRHTARTLIEDYGVAPDRISVATPGTDRPSLPKSPSEPPLILSVGLQHPRKGHDVLIKALARIKDLSWQAVIVGRVHDPEFAMHLKGLVEDLELGERVEIAGTVPRAELNSLYSQATVFALATRYEGYGIVFDEALRYGLPIVSCHAGAVAETVPAAAGMLTPPEESAPFADALRRVLENTPLRHAMATAAEEAGGLLPSWSDTAAVASGVLEGLP